MGKKREDTSPETLEEEVQEIRRAVFKILEGLLPPKEVREEVIRNVYNIEISFLRIFKTLLDYKLETLQQKMEGNKGKKKAKKIEVE